MAVKKSSGESKSQDVSAAKKAGGKKSAAKKETAPKKSAPTAAKTTAAPKKAAGAKKAAPKKAAPIKLSATQTDLLQRIGGTGDPGYRTEKKAEQRTIEALQERKLIKRGAKDKASGSYHYQVSSAGKKHIESSSQGGGASSPTPTS